MRKPDFIRLLCSVCLIVLAGGFSFGQDKIVLKPVSDTYVITGATIIPAAGKKIENGSVLIRKGLIVSVGTNIQVPSDAIVIKADSQYVYPGFIDGLTQAGVQQGKEENRSKPSDPGNPLPEEAGITPYHSVRDYLSPEDKSLEEKLFLGFTAAQVVPKGVFIPGTGASILLGDMNAASYVLQNTSSLYMEYSWHRGAYPSTIMGVMAKWRELYRQTEQLFKYQTIYASNRNGLPRPSSDRVLEALVPVVNKQTPVTMKSETSLEIQRSLMLQRDLGFSLVIGNAKETWDAIPKLKTSGARIFLSLELPEDVAVDSTVAKDGEKAALLKRNQEMVSRYVAQAKTLNDAGIRFGFSSLTCKNKDIKPNLLRMIKAGLPEDVALNALTLTAADPLGLADRMGTIEPGKMANLFIADGPYFKEGTKVQYVFVEGVPHEAEKVSVAKGGKSDIDGSWSMMTDTPQGKSELKIVFRKNGQDYRGCVSGKEITTPVEFSSVSYQKGKLRFVYAITYQGSTFDITVEGNVEGAAFKGNMNVVNYGSFPIEGKKEPKAKQQ